MIRFSQLINLLIPSRLVRRVGRKPLPTTCEEVWIPSRGGNMLYAHLHRPAITGNFSGVVFVPGAVSCGTDYDRAGEIQPITVAALGFVVVHYDPSGRGRTGGEENFWGTRQQDELVDVLQWAHLRPEVKKNCLGVVSFSIGITIATGALARYSTDLPFVRYLYDWEGPSNRFNITKNDTHPPLRQFPTTDDAFWQNREPCQFISRIKCGYFRYQAQIDHMQGQKKDHALELVNLATKGQACWTQLNHNPRDKMYNPPISDSCWITPEKNHQTQILGFFLKVAENENLNV